MATDTHWEDEPIGGNTPPRPAPWPASRTECVLQNDRIGHFQRFADDCLRAAVATALQVSYEDVPLNEAAPSTLGGELDRCVRLAEWAWSRGYRVRFHDEPPKGCRTFVAEGRLEGGGMRHAVAMVDGVGHDPATGFDLPPGKEMKKLTTATHVLVFERKADAN